MLHNPCWPLISDAEWETGQSDQGVRSPEQQAAIDRLRKAHGARHANDIPDLSLEVVPCERGGWDLVTRDAATGRFFLRQYVPADYPARWRQGGFVDDDSSVQEGTVSETGKMTIDLADLWKFLRPRLGMSIDGGKTWFSMPMTTKGHAAPTPERPDPAPESFDPRQEISDQDRDIELTALVKLDRSQGPAILHVEAYPGTGTDLDIGALPGPTFVTLPGGQRFEVLGLTGRPGARPPTTQVWANDLDAVRIPQRRPTVRLTLTIECDDFTIFPSLKEPV